VEGAGEEELEDEEEDRFISGAFVSSVEELEAFRRATKV